MTRGIDLLSSPLKKQQLPILRQRPEGVVDEHFEVVGAVADAAHQAHHVGRVGEGALGHIRHMVGLLAGLDQRPRVLRKGVDVAGDLAVGLDVGLAEGPELVAEDFLAALDALNQNILVSDGGGDNVVEADIAHHAGFDLELLDVGFFLHFDSRGDFGFRQHAGGREHMDRFRLEEGLEGERDVRDRGEPTALRFL